MDNLPFVVLSSVLLQVKLNDQGSRKDLLACSTVNKTWNAAAAPCLYGIIALDTRSLETFDQSFQPEKYAKYVLSLTLRMEHQGKPRLEPYEDHDDHPVLRQALGRFPRLLAQMTNLVSFSLFSPPWKIADIPRRGIIDLVNALPASCTNLELDARATDKRKNDDEPQEKTHMCEAVRRVLPQMQHVRLRLNVLCSSMFVVGSEKDSGSPVDPVRLPKLRSMMIHCGLTVGKCNATDNWVGHNNHSSRLAFRSITESLNKVIDAGLGKSQGKERDGDDMWLKDPDAVSISVFTRSYHDRSDFAIWAVNIRIDMIRKRSWVIPKRHIWPGSDDNTVPASWLVRLPDGRELLGALRDLERECEGDDAAWRSLLGGARLPRRIILAADGDGISRRRRVAELCGGWNGVAPDRPVLKTTAEWRRDNPRKMTHHWRNEEVSGMILIQAEERVGENEYLSLESLVEKTPEGWQRGFQNAVLERASQFAT